MRLQNYMSYCYCERHLLHEKYKVKAILYKVRKKYYMEGEMLEFSIVNIILCARIKLR